MDALLMVLETVVLVGAIVMGTRSSGVGLGVWGGVGTAILVFVFRLPPGSPPIDAMLIIFAVVTAASLMQVAGGIDWMVSIAARAIRSRPKQITFIAPMMAFLFSVGAGTSNVLYPLLPVIYDVSYRNKIPPSRPLSVAVVATATALACSPVAAAMAAMVTLTDVAPYDFSMVQILSVTIPAATLGVLITSAVATRLGPELDDDPEYQARLADGRIAPPTTDHLGPELTSTKEGRRAAIIFLAGVLAVVVLGLFPELRPQVSSDSGNTPIAMAGVIQMVMFVAAALIILVSRPKVADVPGQSVFKAGIVSAIALFGLAWMTDTYITAHEQQIVDTVGGWVNDTKFIFFFAVFLVCALTTSQSTATRTIVPIGLAAGLPPGLVTGMWAGAFAGVYTLPTNGSQIAAANFDETGSTHLGTKLVDHSFFIPMLVLAVSTAGFGVLFATIFY